MFRNPESKVPRLRGEPAFVSMRQVFACETRRVAVQLDFFRCSHSMNSYLRRTPRMLQHCGFRLIHLQRIKNETVTGAPEPAVYLGLSGAGALIFLNLRLISGQNSFRTIRIASYATCVPHTEPVFEKVLSAAGW